MSNDRAYAAGLLNAALDPATQPPEIRRFLDAEEELLSAIVGPEHRVVDVGCGTGRHLLGLAIPPRLGVGFDYERAYIAEAAAGARDSDLAFFVSDATAVALRGSFDLAICLTNTWGTMSDKRGVLDEMRRLAPRSGSRILTVYAPGSIEPRRAWYANLGYEVTSVTETHVETAAGFTSEHFTEDRIAAIVGACELEPIGDVAWLIRA
ncbi:MAG: class I SAM-dependent methyltransferase [Gemmatimonadetes bacterium]|nr:class I SAM-dependent methyltransferase [Gemmatimonadota bacterium]